MPLIWSTMMAFRATICIRCACLGMSHHHRRHRKQRNKCRMSLGTMLLIALSFTKGGSAFPSALKSLRRSAPSARRITFERCLYVSPDTDEPFVFNGTVTVLEEGEHYVVVSKPPSVVCHHSDWSRSRSSKYRATPQPMLQRTRDAIGERVNLVHRLDRGASGCLLLTKAASDNEKMNATATLQQAMAETSSRKTYVALVRGEGILKETDLREQGWFTVDRPIKDESGKVKNATTHFRFLAGQSSGSESIDRPRASLVLARPETGRWHQIRRHLNGLSHPILGDTTHGDYRVNRSWRNEWGMLPERTCLHLAKLEISPNPVCPNGINVSSPLAPDMMAMLENYLPDLLRDAQAALKEEGIDLCGGLSTISEIPIRVDVHPQ